MSSQETLWETFQLQDTPKVWSLIATIFGDLDGDRLAGKQLRTLLENVGVKPETIRVALHRLKNDGWIISSKTGREVTYSLSDHGREETLAAQTDIYRIDPKFSQVGRVFVVKDEATLLELQGPKILLAKNLVLMLDPEPGAPDSVWDLGCSRHPVPNWIETQLVPPHLVRQADGLLRSADCFDGIGEALSPEALASARLLFIHYWRKLALRDGTWAHVLMVPEGSVAQCHRRVTGILARTKKLTPPKV